MDELAKTLIQYNISISLKHLTNVKEMLIIDFKKKSKIR